MGVSPVRSRLDLTGFRGEDLKRAAMRALDRKKLKWRLFTDPKNHILQGLKTLCFKEKSVANKWHKNGTKVSKMP